MHDFLSPEWVAAADDIHTRYRGRAPEIPVSVRINMTITDVPFGDDPSIGAFIDTTGGEMLFRVGQLAEADVTVITDYEVAKAIALGAEPAAFMEVFLAGRVKVQGDMTRLLVLQANFPQGDIADQLADEVRAITR